MKIKKIISLLTAVLCLTTLYGCNNSSTTETAEHNTPSAESSPSVTAVSITQAEHSIKATLKSVPKLTAPSQSSNSAVSSAGKNFHMSVEDTVSLHLPKGWELIDGAMRTIAKKDVIMADTAVLQYLDTKTTISMAEVNEIEDKETFLANTEESYKQAYGSSFDSIDITEYEQLSIDEKDSFIIKANVVVKGEKFTMTHILSNDVFGKTYSFMLLDSDGKFADFDLVEAITYHKNIDISDLRKDRRKDLIK